MFSYRSFSFDNGLCPYLEKRFWRTVNIYSKKIDASFYEELINQGFRRSGFFYYRNICSGCSSCYSIKIDVEAFNLSLSQKRVQKKNLEVQAVLEDKALFSEDIFLLYNSYINFKHNQPFYGRGEFIEFLANQPDFSKTIKFYYKQKLIAVSWIDILQNGISSSYSAFLPEYKHLSLGVYTALYEINLAREKNLKWYYLGYWVPNSVKMQYKSNYRPCYILTDKGWQLLFDKK